VVTVHLTAEDVARTRFGFSTVWETTAGLYAVTSTSARALHRPLHRQLTAAGRKAVEAMSDLVGVPGWMPDSLAPQPQGAAIDPVQELSGIRRTPDCVVERDLDVLRRKRPASRWAAMDRDQFVDELAGTLTAYWECELAPHWEVIESVVRSDVRSRQGQLAGDGIAATLHKLHPAVTFEHSALEVHLPLHRCEINGSGAGLWLVPSVFRWSGVGLASSTNGTLVLSYPARGAGTVWEDRKGAAPGVESLIGRSRAAVLADLDVPRSTTELARRLQLAPATVSAHLSTLADARLVVGTRYGRAVLYARTRLGALLLTGGQDSFELTEGIPR
jgi:DNA-binding transcriptional ArsR family regulator